MASESYINQLQPLRIINDQADQQAMAQWLRNKLLGLDLEEYDQQLKAVFKHFDQHQEAQLKLALEALEFLVLYLAKIKGNSKDLDSILTEANVPQKLNQILQSAFTQGVFEKLRNDLQVIKEINKFQNIKWRLDMQIGTKNLKQTYTPKMLLQLNLRTPQINQKNQQDGSLKFTLQSDYPNLKRMHDELQTALASLNDPYSRKIYKFVK